MNVRFVCSIQLLLVYVLAVGQHKDRQCISLEEKCYCNTILVEITKDIILIVHRSLGGERKEVLAAHSSPLLRANGGIDHGLDMGDLAEEEHDDHPLSRLASAEQGRRLKG